MPTERHYLTCAKCKEEGPHVTEIKVAAQNKKINLCHSCKTDLLECLFSWDWTGDCGETINSLEEFMRNY